MRSANHFIMQPENLLLTADGHIKIADFGSVKPMQDSRITVLPNVASGKSLIYDKATMIIKHHDFPHKDYLGF